MKNADVHKLMGNRIRDKRNAIKISQEELAFRSGVSLNQLGRIERGERSPTLVTLLKICEGLDILLQELFEGIHTGGKRANHEKRLDERDLLDKKIFDILKNLSADKKALIHRLVKELTDVK